MFTVQRYENLERWFPFVDVAVAQQLLPSADEEVLAFLAYLSLATRRGHLCVEVSAEHLLPSPQDIMKEEYQRLLLTDETLAEIQQALLRGVTLLPNALVTDVATHNIPRPVTPLCRDDTRYYLQKYWMQETRLLQAISSLMATPPSIQVNTVSARQEAEELVRNNILLPEQAQVILQCCEQSLAFISGGPGTGKTFTAAHLVAILWNHLDKPARSHTQIALAAPTGKAASNLQKSINRVVGQLQGIPPLKAVTLHALLGIGSKSRSPLMADFILVDESSMIDVDLMVALLESAKPGARLVFIGDPHQLPPVEAGGIFGDLVEAFKPSELKTCLRTESQAIVNTSHAVLQGKPIPFHLLPPSSASKSIVDILFEKVSAFFDSGSDPVTLMEKINAFRLLSPVRKGPYGVDNLNEQFNNRLLKAAKGKSTFVAPIIVVRNASDLSLNNGEVGLMVYHQPGQHVQAGDYALFPCADTPQSVRRIPALLMPPYELAYCLSVHKSQGSEFDDVVLLLPEGSEAFGREMLYTGVTRAKKTLEVWASPQVMDQVLAFSNKRFSGITKRLKSFLLHDGFSALT